MAAYKSSGSSGLTASYWDFTAKFVKQGAFNKQLQHFGEVKVLGWINQKSSTCS